MLTKLDAVNEMLEAIMEDPVESLSSGQIDAEKAERWLGRVSRDVQSVGWKCNTYENLLLTRNVNNEIVLPTNTIRVTPTGTDEGLNVVKKGSRLYDLDNNTFTFDVDIYVDLVLEEDFEDLPYDLQYVILCKAGRLFQEGAIASVSLDGFTKDKENEAWAKWLDAAFDSDQTNILTASPSVAAVVGRNNRLRGQ